MTSEFHVNLENAVDDWFNITYKCVYFKQNTKEIELVTAASAGGAFKVRISVQKGGHRQ